jgi:type IX secretion system PorP/SprF family membrane protein
MLHKFISGFINKLLQSKAQLLVCFCLSVASGSLKAQQEPMYSQYMFNLLNVNPAYAGNRTVDNVTLMYRNQWLGVDGAPVTGTLSWDRRKEDSNIGYGLQIYNDRLGVEKTSGVQAFYSYRIPFKRSFISFGLSAGVLNYRAAYSQVQTINPDPLFQEDISAILPTVGIGFLYATDNWYAALSVPALLKTKVTTNNNQVTTSANNHYFLTTGYLFKVSESLKLKPSVMLKAVKGAPFEYDFNLNGWIHDIVGIGASYRTGDAFIGMFELQMTPNIRIGYAYDYLISNLKNYSKGTHELMLRYEFLPAKSKRILSPRYY